MIKIALDIMGGDNAPYSNIDGAIDFLNENHSSVKLYLVGDKKLITSHIASKFGNYNNNDFEIVHTTEIITSKDKPSKIIKLKPDSSMNKSIIPRSRWTICSTGSYVQRLPPKPPPPKTATAVERFFHHEP